MTKLLVTVACAAMMLVSCAPVYQTAGHGQTRERALRVRVGGPIYPPERTTTVVPSYPSDADAGTVVLDVTIDPQGRVDAVEVLQTLTGATDAAVAAVSQWEYIPILLNGEPIWLIMVVAVPSPWA